MQEREYLRFLKKFLAGSLLLLLLAAGIVVVFDPFYHYHGPIGNLKAVVTKSEYQCIGTLRNFDYDSVIAGSSVAENYNNHWFDEAFGCRSVKAIKSSGTAADLTYYLKEAFASREVKNVFYNLDLFSLDGDPGRNFLDDSMPLYLFNQNPLDDVKYVLNKDILFEHIPYLLATTYLDDYDEGTSYNWAQYKTFGKEEALAHYDRAETVTPMLAKEQWQDKVDGNLTLIQELAEAHPETEFYFFLPPYSMLWWDNMYRTGQLEEYRYGARAAMERLIPYDNVKFFYFQNEEEIILNLDYYMDPVHFTADINHLMVDRMAAGENQVTLENYEGELQKMDELIRRILTEEIEEYY